MSQAVLAPINSASSPAVAFRTLLAKEMLRFWKVSFQTIGAPVLTSVLYLLVFGQVLATHVEAFPGVSYVAFLIPGLVMMSVLQNAFANSSSSLIQSKIMVVPTPDGERNALVLGAAWLGGVSRAFAVGGAQAVAALAYGTATIPAVDKIVGPGNAYVAAAKRRVFGTVGIDMLAKRIIPCLDVTGGRVVKGVNFVELRDAGDPVEVARRYDGEGADELTFLDITASSDQRDIILHGSGKRPSRAIAMRRLVLRHSTFSVAVRRAITPKRPAGTNARRNRATKAPPTSSPVSMRPATASRRTRCVRSTGTALQRRAATRSRP